MNQYLKIQSNIQNREHGVALLFVILLTSVLLLVAIGISSVAYKEAAFSIEARDSDRAFFAADTGIECALMFDTGGLFGGTPTVAAVCNGNSYSTPFTDLGGGTYAFAVPVRTNQCAQVSINKHALIGGVDYTQISSVGYNVTGASLSSCLSGAAGPRVVTRALLTRYAN